MTRAEFRALVRTLRLVMRVEIANRRMTDDARACIRDACRAFEETYCTDASSNTSTRRRSYGI